MPKRHLFIALFTVAIWGMNFIFIKLALREIPPITLSALRFLFTALPLVFFLRRPQVKWFALIGYGLAIFAVQFGMLFYGMKLGMSAGLASMVAQTQVFFTIALSAVFFHERPKFTKIIGALIAFSGVALVGFHSSQDVSVPGLILVLIGALGWGTGNVVSKSMGPVNSVALVVWGALIATPPLSFLAWLLERNEIAVIDFAHLSSVTVWSLIYIVYASTHVGFSLWAWLLRQHAASSVAPFTLLVPVFGFLGSVLILHETLPDWKVHAALLVVGGLCVNLYNFERLWRRLKL
nr:EamA-like transporter family [uncultured bacterium]